VHVIYQSNENEADYQIMHEKQSRSHIFVTADEVNLTKVQHSFAANSATKRTVKTQTGSNSRSIILTRDQTRPYPVMFSWFRLCRKNRSTRSIRQYNFDIVAGVDMA